MNMVDATDRFRNKIERWGGRTNTWGGLRFDIEDRPNPSVSWVETFLHIWHVTSPPRTILAYICTA
jgi:hypothetical protein